MAPRSDSAALACLAVASPLALAALVAGGPAGEAAFAALSAAFPVALIALGAARGGRVGPLAGPLLALIVLLGGSLAAMLALRGRVLEAPWIGGLPLAAQLMFWCAWLVPLLVTGLAYAWTFDRFTLPGEVLERLRRLRGDRSGEP